MNYILGLAGSKTRHVGESSRARAPVTSLTSDLGSKSTSLMDPEQGNQSSLVTPQATMPMGTRSFARTSPAGHRANELGVGVLLRVLRRPPCQRVLGVKFCPYQVPQAIMPTD